jgi:hypothetical protein
MIDLKPLGAGPCTLIRANSKYVTVMNCQEKYTNVGIFDLYAAEKTTGCNGPLSYFTVSKFLFKKCHTTLFTAVLVE